MTSDTKNQCDQVTSVRENKSRGTGLYIIGDQEWADLQEALRQADRKEFVSDEAIADADKRRGI
jgi:hypothetical protein